MAESFDVVGEDMDVVGALLQRAGGAPKLAARPALRVATPGWMAPPGVPQGVTLPQEEMDPLPFAAVEFTFGASASNQLIAFPQRPFRGERLIAGALFVPAAGAPVNVSDGVLIDPAIYVGATQVGASQGAMPLSVYASTAFGVRLSFPSAGQGTRIVIPIRHTLTLAAGDRIIVTATVIGRAVR